MLLVTLLERANTKFFDSKPPLSQHTCASWSNLCIDSLLCLHGLFGSERFLQSTALISLLSVNLSSIFAGVLRHFIRWGSVQDYFRATWNYIINIVITNTSVYGYIGFLKPLTLCFSHRNIIDLKLSSSLPFPTGFWIGSAPNHTQLKIHPMTCHLKTIDVSL